MIAALTKSLREPAEQGEHQLVMFIACIPRRYGKQIFEVSLTDRQVFHDTMPVHAVPEIQRVPLDQYGSSS